MLTIKTRIRLISIALATFVGVQLSAANAAPVLYSTGSAGSVSTLYQLNTATGAATAVGATGHNLGIGGLAYDSDSSTLFATGFATGQTDSLTRLFRVDSATGAAIVIGSTGVFSLTGLAYNTANDTLYGVGCQSPCGGNIFNDFLYSINIATGAATQLFNLGPIVGSSAGLEYVASTNLLYAIGETSPTNVYSIDPTSGAVTTIGSPGGLIVGGLAFDETSALMYGTNADQSFIDALHTFSLANGARTLVGVSGAFLSQGGLAFVPDGTVPEPGTLALVVPALLLLLGVRRPAR